MYNDCIELINLLARPDGIVTLDQPIIFASPNRMDIHLYAAQVSPTRSIYAYMIWEDDQIDLNNQAEWYELNMKHHFDRCVVSLLLLKLSALERYAARATDSLLSELNIEKEVTV